MEQRLILRPGQNLELTPLANKGGWSTGSNCRWRWGMPEIIGGWVRLSSTPLAGSCRALHFWSDLVDNPWLAAGTNSHLYLERAGTVFDITPVGFVPGLSSSNSSMPFSLLIWSLDNFGQNLVAIRSGGALYQWVPPNTAARAVIVPQAPAVNQGGFVMMQQQIVMAYGCTPLGGGPADPMLVRWCDQSDITDWIATTTNQAGSYRLPRGNRIVGGLQVPSAAFLWTDFDAWAVQYIGFPLVFSFTEVGTNCGLISQKAVTVAGTVPYWMSDHGFFRMGSGGAEQIPCPVWDYVFKNLDEANQDKCLAGLDYHYSEVYFFFPSKSGGTGEIDSYVSLNFSENVWSTGLLERTAWTDANRPGPPLGVDGAGLIQQHDTGFSADGAKINAFIQSGYIDLADGTNMVLANRLIPDFVWAGPDPQVNIYMLFRRYPGDTPTTTGPFLVTPNTELITLTVPVGPNNSPAVGVRGREVAIQIASNSSETFWRMGACRLRLAPDGRGP